MVRCYGNLYSQARVEALEKLDMLPQLIDATELKSKILFSVVVVSARAERHEWRKTVGLINLFFSLLSVGVQIDASHVDTKKRTSEKIVVLPDAVRFGARRTGSFYLFVLKENG